MATPHETFKTWFPKQKINNRIKKKRVNSIVFRFLWTNFGNMQKCKSIAPPKRNSGNIPSTRHKIQFHRQQQAKNIIDHESQKHRITFTTTGGTYPFLKINKYFFYTRSRTAFMFRFFSVNGLSGFHVGQGFTRDLYVPLNFSHAPNVQKEL